MYIFSLIFIFVRQKSEICSQLNTNVNWGTYLNVILFIKTEEMVLTAYLLCHHLCREYTVL